MILKCITFYSIVLLYSMFYNLQVLFYIKIIRSNQQYALQQKYVCVCVRACVFSSNYIKTFLKQFQILLENSIA